MLVQKRGSPSNAKQLPFRRHLGEDVDAYFGRLGRDGVEEIQSASRLVLGVPLLQEIINAMPVPVSVLNEKGQVILTNRCWDRSAGEGADCLLGKRHAPTKTASGCSRPTRRSTRPS